MVIKKEQKKSNQNRFNSQSTTKNKFSNSKKKPAKLLDSNLFIKKATAQVESQYVSNRLITDLPVDKDIIANLKKKGYDTPTEIQDKSIEAILSGKDLLGLAKTGTGKTGAYLIPIVHSLIQKKPSFQVLIISPTRELAVQIEEEYKSISLGLKLNSTCLIGGTSVSRDMSNLRSPSHVVIGTPGRITDMVRQRSLNLKNFSVLVLDEFDRLLDMGFSHDIQRLVEGMSNRKQTILFSATEEKGQKQIIVKLLKNPTEVKLNTGNSSADSIEQEIVRVKETENKMDVLLKMLKDPSFEKVLVFAETKRWVSKVCKNLRQAGVKADEIHGNKSQNYRTKALHDFKNEKIKVLVATDVAARGLDIVDVSHVINYQQPLNLDSYIHRIGRTGRAGKSGKAYTFVN
jgi:ATP-dependent RNA helicase RhlE